MEPDKNDEKYEAGPRRSKATKVPHPERGCYGWATCAGCGKEVSWCVNTGEKLLCVECYPQSLSRDDAIMSEAEASAKLAEMGDTSHKMPGTPRKNPKCKTCLDRGVILLPRNRAEGEDVPSGWALLRRCSACRVYPDSREAAMRVTPENHPMPCPVGYSSVAVSPQTAEFLRTGVPSSDNTSHKP